jgi:RNA polymerase sigma-70 factor (ECF subfamily)
MSGREPPTFTTGLFQRIRGAEDDERARKAAFDELTTYFWPVLTGWARRRGCGAETAEEIAQQVLLRVWTHLGGFDDGLGRPRQWMYGIFRRCLADVWAQQRRWHPLLTAEQQAGLSSAEAGDDLVQEVMMKELLELAKERAERDLPTQFPAYRQVEDGRAPAEVAGLLGLKVSSVIQYHRNVRRQVEEELERLCREHTGAG